MSSSNKEYDIVVMGATGFTGGLVAEYLDSLTSEPASALKLAIAGRDKAKLEKVKSDRLKRKEWGIIIADVNDEKSLDAMAAKAKVIINTAGPFTQYGPPVVKAAIKQSAHYIDSTGEPKYVSDMYKLHDIARQKKVWIVPACGFDSIPADITNFSNMTKLTKEEKLGASVTSRSYAVFGGMPSGGTFNTFIDGISKSNTPENREIMSKVRGRIHRFSPQGFAIPLPTSDPIVVDRSSELLRISSAGSSTDVTAFYPSTLRSEIYIVLPSLWSIFKIVTAIFVCFLLAQFAFGRSILRRLLPPGTGPDVVTRRRSYFNTTCETQVDFNGKKRTITTTMRGGDPGYTETAKMLSECGLALALDHVKQFDSQRPKAAGEVGGVASPAAVFGPVLIERLSNAGMLFTTQEDSE